MFAKRRCDRCEVFSRRAVFEHVASGTKGVLRHRPEMAELRTMLSGPLRGGNEIVLCMAATLGVRARPAVAAVAADDGGGQPCFDRHDGEDDRQNLAGAAIVETGAEIDVDA